MSETESNSLTLAELTDRLRGVYRIPIMDGMGAVGGGDEPDNPNHFVRHFDTAPIQHKAAYVIDQLAEIIDNARMAFAETQPDDDTRMRAMAAALSAMDEIEIPA